MNLSNNMLDIHSINYLFVTIIPSGHPKCEIIESFLSTDPGHPRHSKFLSIHEMRLDFLHWICNPDANANWIGTCIPFSNGACKNMRDAKAYTTHCLSNGRCGRPTMSPLVAGPDNITNKGWPNIANNNGMRGHPWVKNARVQYVM